MRRLLPCQGWCRTVVLRISVCAGYITETSFMSKDEDVSVAFTATASIDGNRLVNPRMLALQDSFQVPGLRLHCQYQ